MQGSKNSRTGQNRSFMGHHEGEMLNTLPKYNYCTGAGWKKHKRHQRKSAFGIYTVIRKVGQGRAGRML